MKRILCIFAFSLLLSGSLWAQAKVQVVGGSKLDLGTIYRGQVVEKKVVLKNVGDQVLEIGRVDASCGCTGTLVSSKQISPGKTGELLITFNSANFSGSVHKSVTVNSNADGSPSTLIEFSATVVQEISVTPVQFWFRDAEVGKATSASVTLTNQSKENVDIMGYKTNLAGFTLSIPAEPLKPGESVQLVAEYTPKAVMSILNDGVSVKTSSKREPDVFIRIFGNVREFVFK
ncbi:MAG: DUF1573 domain-containing protein [Ignavibacteriae bacterium]|nr:DUF1573 domain-containing protein [Ignavibacteriota bacterium]